MLTKIAPQFLKVPVLYKWTPQEANKYISSLGLDIFVAKINVAVWLA
jgi:hypothetical protein